MTVKEHITKKISRSLDGSLFFNNSFPNYDDVYVRQILSELCSQGLIARISLGIYVKPMRSKFGIVYPPVGEIVKAIAMNAAPFTLQYLDDAFEGGDAKKLQIVRTTVKEYEQALIQKSDSIIRAERRKAEELK